MSRKSVVKIQHIFSFMNADHKLVSKGENALESNHVKSLSYDGDKLIIAASVEASMKDKTYRVQLILEKNGEIQDGKCECPRGLSRCHHMAATLLYAHHNVSITDGQCKWNYKKPLKRSHDVKDIDEMFPTKRFQVISGGTAAETRSNIYSKLIESNEIVGYSWLLSPEPVPSSLKHPTLEQVILSKEFKESTNKASFLGEKCSLNRKTIMEIEAETRGQSSNWKWAKYRNLLVTASNFGYVIAAEERGSFPPSLFKRIHGFGNLDKVKQVQWGKQQEKNAILKFEQSMKIKVRDSGIWLHSSGFLGASPDGIITNPDGSISVVEVKCPYKYRNDHLNEKLKTIKDYIIYIDDQNCVQVNKKHMYYHQIQGQIAITNASCAFLVVWTIKSVIICKIQKDNNWVYLDFLADFFIFKWIPWLLSNKQILL